MRHPESTDGRRESQGRQTIREAEDGKANMIATPGNFGNNYDYHGQCRETIPFANHKHPATIVDENYMVVGMHIDDSIKKKIINHEYVDFARLLSKDRVFCEEDNHMELVS